MSRHYLRVALLTLAPLLIVAGPVIWGSQVALESMFNAPFRWVDYETPALNEFNRFLDEFGSVEYVLVSWQGGTLDDPRFVSLADAIDEAERLRESRGEPRLINHVMTGYSVVRSLTEPPADMSRRDALLRLYGSLVGKDGETSCAVVALSDIGSAQRRETIDHLLEIIKQSTGLDREDLRLAGPAVDGLAIDDESIASMKKYSAPAIALSFVLCCLFLRSLWLTLPIMLVGGLGQAASLAVIHFAGITMNAVLIVLPPLVFVLTVSAGVHLVNYFYEEPAGDGNRGESIRRALTKARGPCWMAAITTAIGLSSLTISDVEPVRVFGAVAAVGVLVTVLLLFLLLPGAMQARTWFRWRSPIRFSVPWFRHGIQSHHGFASRGGALVWKLSSWVSISSFTLLAFCSVGLLWIRSSIDVVSLLDQQNRAMQDFRWFERQIGPLIPVEVVIRFGPANELDPLERLELIRAVQKQLMDIPESGGWLSVASFLPDPPRRGGLRVTAQRAVLRKQIAANRQEFEDARYMKLQSGGEQWRISGRLFGMDDFDYAQFLDQLRERVAPVLQAYEQAGQSDIDATYTGVTAVVYEVELSLLRDLFDSFLAALALITLVMIFALRSVRAGFIAMVPNVFPTIIMFGTMGWLDHTIDIGTVMTASVALGIAVDGTFHFMKWFCHEIDAGRGRLDAIVHAYRHCGLALIQTTLICGCGLLVFALSGFLPARYFSFHLFVLLVLALIGDLVVLPALLAGPMGNVFERSGKDAER